MLIYIGVIWFLRFGLFVGENRLTVSLWLVLISIGVIWFFSLVCLLLRVA